LCCPHIINPCGLRVKLLLHPFPTGSGHNPLQIVGVKDGAKIIVAGIAEMHNPLAIRINNIVALRNLQVLTAIVAIHCFFLCCPAPIF
jgi:hypothetical protein